MKKTYLSLPKHAARISSRRFPQHAFSNVAYKEDAFTPEALVAQLHEIKSNIQAHVMERQTQLEAMVKTTIDGFDQIQARMKGMPLNTVTPSFGPEATIRKTLYDSKDQIKKFLDKQMSGDLVISHKVVGDISLAGNVTGGTASTSSILPGIIKNPNRKQHIGVFLSRTPIKGDLIYLKENGAGEGGFTAVSEGGTKPEVDFDLIEVTAPANFIAGYCRVSRRFMLSVDNAMDFLTSRLTEAYYRAEDAAILNGTGISPEMKGINVAGNFTAATSGGLSPYSQLVIGVGQLAALERNPDMIILHPDDYYRLLVNISAETGEYDSPKVAQFNADGSAMIIAGCAVVVSTAQTAGQYTIVDRSGLLIGVLDSFNIRFFEGGSTEVITNKILVRAESALALAVFANNYVVKGTFNAFVS